MNKPLNYIIKFDKFNSVEALNQVKLESEEAVMAYALDNGLNLAKATVEKKGEITFYTFPKSPQDWTVVKNHFQKMKEIPGYAEEFKKNYVHEDYYTKYENKKYLPSAPCSDGKTKKNNNKKKSKYGKENFDNVKYYVYDKGKLAKVIKKNGLAALSGWVEAKQVFITSIERKSKYRYYVYICHKEDIARLLPEKLVIKRFEEIVNAKGIGDIDLDKDDYEHLEL